MQIARKPPGDRPDLPPGLVAALARQAAALAPFQMVSPDPRTLGPLMRETQNLLAGAAPPPCPPATFDPARIPLVAPFAQLGMLADVPSAAPLLAVAPGAIEAVRAGRGAIVFDCANEGRALIPRHVQALHALLEHVGVAPARAVWAQQNRAFEGAYHAFCAQRGLTPMHVVVAHSHAAGLWRRLVMARGRGINWRYGFAAEAGGERRFRWVCLNYNLRPHRALLAAWLRARPEPGFLSFSVTRETHGRSDDHRLVEGAAALDPADAQGARAAVRRLLDDQVHFGSDLDDHAHPSERIYSLPAAEVAAAEIFVVTETEMDGRGLVRWTEKTMKALATGLPFIVFGNAGVIAELRALGFDTLDDLVDHAYDSEAEPARRFVAARAALARFLARPPGFTPGEQARLRAAAAQNGAVFTERLIEDVMLAPMARILAIAAG